MGLETEGDRTERRLRPHHHSDHRHHHHHRKQADRAQVESCIQTKGIKICLDVGCIPLLHFALVG